MLNNIKFSSALPNSDNVAKDIYNCNFLERTIIRDPLLFLNMLCPSNDYCLKEDGIWTHLKNIKNVSYNDANNYRRIVQTPPDWATILDDSTRSYVK